MPVQIAPYLHRTLTQQIASYPGSDLKLSKPRRILLVTFGFIIIHNNCVMKNGWTHMTHRHANTVALPLGLYAYCHSSGPDRCLEWALVLQEMSSKSYVGPIFWSPRKITDSKSTCMFGSKKH